jgi:hypothetical protein
MSLKAIMSNEVTTTEVLSLFTKIGWHTTEKTVADITMVTSRYHGDRAVASPVNGGELPKGCGVSHCMVPPRYCEVRYD